MHTVTKVANRPEMYRRRMFFFANARTALRAYLHAIGISKRSTVLLPAYIGWSSREGSGVYDPIHEIGASSIFYRVSPRLEADVQDVMEQIRTHRPQLLVLIHYFGFPDPNAVLLTEFAHSQGIPVVEDEAHAMLSDIVGGVCGRSGDAAIYSFHKLLPFPDGGALLLREESQPEVVSRLEQHASNPPTSFYDYDLLGIAERRRTNSVALLDYLSEVGTAVSPLHTEVSSGVVPQTLPVLIHAPIRDELYFRLNAIGFGVVSLYHTLIAPIDPVLYPLSASLSRNILNLPVHQDTDPKMLRRLVEHLRETIVLVSKERNVPPSPAVVEHC